MFFLVGSTSSAIEVCQQPAPWQIKVLRCYNAEKKMLRSGLWCDKAEHNEDSDIENSICVLDGNQTLVRCDFGKKSITKEVAARLQKSLDEKYQDQVKCGAVDDLSDALKAQAESTVQLRFASEAPQPSSQESIRIAHSSEDEPIKRATENVRVAATNPSPKVSGRNLSSTKPQTATLGSESTTKDPSALAKCKSNSSGGGFRRRADCTKADQKPGN